MKEIKQIHFKTFNVEAYEDATTHELVPDKYYRGDKVLHATVTAVKTEGPSAGTPDYDAAVKEMVKVLSTKYLDKEGIVFKSDFTMPYYSSTIIFLIPQGFTYEDAIDYVHNRMELEKLHEEQGRQLFEDAVKRVDERNAGAGTKL